MKIGRNDPCRCGSGKKYKQCCGRPQTAWTATPEERLLGINTHRPRIVPIERKQAQLDAAWGKPVAANFIFEKFLGIMPDELDASIADDTLAGGPYDFGRGIFTVSKSCGARSREVEVMPNARIMLEELKKQGNYAVIPTHQLTHDQFQLLHREDGRDSVIAVYYITVGRDLEKTIRYFGLVPPPPRSYFESMCEPETPSGRN